MRGSAKLLVPVLLAACGSGSDAAPAQAGAARGAEVYREQDCQACHSIAGAGNRRHPLDGVGARLTADQIRTWIVAPREMNPRVRKPAYDRLPQADLDALVAYLAGLRNGAAESPARP